MNPTQILLYSLGILLPLQAGFYYEEAVEHYFKLSYFPIIALWLFGTKKSKFNLTPVAYCTIGLIIWSTISSLFALKIELSLFEVTRYVVVLILYLYIANYCDDIKYITAILFSLFISLAFENLIGIYQNHFGLSIGLDFLGEGSGELWSWRAIGTLRFPNTFGTYLVLLIPIIVCLFFVPIKNKLKLKLGFLLPITIAVLIFTYSRTSWLSLVFAMMVFVFLFFIRGLIDKKMMKMIVPVALIMSVFVIHYSGKIVERWGQKTDDTKVISIDDHRFNTAEIALDLIKKEPLFGVGLRNFPFFADNSNVHTTYLRIASESGIPALIFFLLIAFFILRDGWKLTKSKNILISRLAIGIFSSNAALMLMIVTGPEFRWFPILGIYWLFAGLLIAMKKLDLKLKRKEKFNKKAAFLKAMNSADVKNIPI